MWFEVINKDLEVLLKSITQIQLEMGDWCIEWWWEQTEVIAINTETLSDFETK